MTLVTMFQQQLFHKQNVKLEQEKHKQNLELEEKKRTDYLVCKNYDTLFEIAKILNQITLTWWQVTSRAEEQKEEVEISLWDCECPIHEKFKTEQINFASFLKQYNYIIPKEVCDKLCEAESEYKQKNFKKARELIIDAEFSLNNLIGIKKSQEEIRKRFQLISK